MPSDHGTFDIDPDVTKRLVGLGNRLLDEAGTGDHQVPTHPIHHYTTASGLVGILRSRRLWATNTDYLNDTSELAYGRRIALEIIRDKHGTLNNYILPASMETVLSTPEKILLETPFDKLAPWALLAGLWETIRTFKESEYYVVSYVSRGIYSPSGGDMGIRAAATRSGSESRNLWSR